MLTSYQASPGAYHEVESGLLFCLDCAHRRAEERGVDTSVDFDTMFIHFYGVLDPNEYEPVIGYALDEMQSADAEAAHEWGAEEGGYWAQHEECEPELLADGCGHVLREENHYGCDEVSNVPVPRWVPCGHCGAGDGEPHRDGCEEVRK